MTEILTLTKLIILYMLDSANHSLSKSQIFSFIIDNEYTNYFTLMQASTELVESEFVKLKISKNSTYFVITDEGRETLNSFEDRISAGIKEDIAAYFKDNLVQTKSPLSIETNYFRVGRGGYVAELIAKEKNTELINLKINMPTEEAVSAMCKNFEERHEEIYDLLIDNLL